MDDFRTILNRYHKQDLLEYVSVLELPGVSASDRKDFIINSIADFILKNPEVWLYSLTEADFVLLKKAIAAGREQRVPMGFNPLPSALENLHVIDVEYDDEGEEFFAIVPDVYDVICGKVDEVFDAKEKKGSFHIDRMILSILNYYGMVPAKVFMDALEDLRKASGFRDILVEDLSDSSILMFSRIFEGGQLYLATPYLSQPEQILDLRKQNRSPKGNRYARIDTQRALETAELMPYGTFGVKTPEGRAVLEMLRSLGYSEEESLDELHDIWLNAQYPMREMATSMMFASVDEVENSVGHFDRYEDCVKAIADYANIVPKWILRGFTANDVDMLKVTIATEDHSYTNGDEYTDDDDAAVPEFLRKPLPQPDTTTDVSKYGIAIKRVGLSDPCPCGSGLTYGRCHGKHIN